MSSTIDFPNISHMFTKNKINLYRNFRISSKNEHLVHVHCTCTYSNSRVDVKGRGGAEKILAHDAHDSILVHSTKQIRKFLTDSNVI